MHISIPVTHSERRARRVVRHLVRGQLKSARLSGALTVVCGVALLLPGSSLPPWVAIGAIALGLFFAVGLEPYAVSRTLRMQSTAGREDYVLTLQEDGIAASGQSYDCRYAWSALDKVVEVPDAWYLMFGKAQALPVYKELMTERQTAEFTAFLARRDPARTA